MSAEKNEVARMIQQIRDRLDDVEESLEAYEGDLTGYAERLDRIDDRLFEIEEEFEQLNEPCEGDDAPASTEGDAGTEEENEFDPHITREGVQQATNDLNSIYKTGYETVTELAGAMSDIKEAFDFKSLLKPKKPE
ncbi:MAG TPA: hypothetical protein IAA69_06135 [Candidatus Aveggerthella stercoripullorum]|jgi:archaellum component FlaC|uniref:Uncharacterized protein n=1 Tax=Candidatus Aveggerthella stercoripullorum TaxID=2840688 RepID=A0A9D1A1C0_9ACTN|nr:hypothetical protein [Candidatus Aveggerthella stercoripullorum]